MKFLKKLFGRKSEEEIEWNVTPVSDLSTVAASGSSSEKSDSSELSNDTSEMSSDSKDDAEGHFEALPSAPDGAEEALVQGLENQNIEPNESPSLIKHTGSEFIPAQQSLAEIEINEVLEAIETGSEYEAQVINEAANEWQGFGAPAQGRRMISLFRESDDFSHRQHLEKQRSIISGLVEEEAQEEAEADQNSSAEGTEEAFKRPMAF